MGTRCKGRIQTKEGSSQRRINVSTKNMEQVLYTTYTLVKKREIVIENIYQVLKRILYIWTRFIIML